MNADDILETKKQTDVYIPEHEVLISFYDDENADKFYQWFDTIGKNDFVNWLAEQDERQTLSPPPRGEGKT